MAFSPTDPVSAHSLWLQLRSTKRKHRRPRWRGDWTPLWVLLLLSSILALSYVIMPSNDSIERAEQAAQKVTVLQESPVLDVTDLK